MTFTQLTARLKKFLRGWLLVLGPNEGLVNCATVCIKSEVILLYMPSTFYRKTEPTMCCLILTQPEVQCFHVYCSPDPPTKTKNLYCTASCLRSNFMLSHFDMAVGTCFRKYNFSCRFAQINDLEE